MELTPSIPPATPKRPQPTGQTGGIPKISPDQLTGTGTTLTGDVTGSGVGSFATTIASNVVGNTKLRDSVALSVIGRSANSGGDPADIAASSDGDILRRSGTTLGFGSILAASVSDFDTEVSNNTDVAANTAARHDAVTLAGTPDYITISGQVITRGLIDLTTDITGDLPFANLAQLTANSIAANATGSTADMAALTIGANTFPARSSAGNMAAKDITDFGLSLVDDADAATARATLGLVAGGTGDIWVEKAGDTMTGNLTISNTAPSLVLTDTTASAKGLTIAVDADFAEIRESAGASGSLLVFDLTNNRVGIGDATPDHKLDIDHSTTDATAALGISRTDSRSSTTANIPTAINASYVDASTGNRLSAQTLRFTFTKNSGATGAPTAFDTLIDVGATVNDNAAYIMRGMTIEGPTVAAGKTLGTWQGIMINEPGGAGTTTTFNAITTLGGSVIFNENGGNYDFRVESDNNAFTLNVVGSSGNVKIAGSAVRATTEGTNHLDIFDGTAPVGTLANGISLYSTSGELRVMDSAGNPTLLSPHDKDNNWIFDSYVGKGKDRKRIVVDMQKMIYALNEMFGWDFIHEFSI